MDYRLQPAKVSRWSIVISAMLHGSLVIALLAFAAREGVFGKRVNKIAISILPQEKPSSIPQVPLVKAPVSPTSKLLEVHTPAKPANHPAAKAVPVFVAEPTLPSPQALAVNKSDLPVAPPVAAIPDMIFGGGSTAETSADPQILYRGFLEYSLRSNWRRPAGLNDIDWVAEVKIFVDPSGRVVSGELEKSSGNKRWDRSVREAVARTRFLERPPPKGFPPMILVRFDIQADREITKP